MPNKDIGRIVLVLRMSMIYQKRYVQTNDAALVKIVKKVKKIAAKMT